MKLKGRDIKMSKVTTLPRIAPPETTITSVLYPSTSQDEPRRKSYSSIGYRELSNTWGGSLAHHPHCKPAPHTATGVSRSLPRLDPLHPPKHERTVSLETTLPHYQNELRTLNMKREQYHKFHRSWMKPIYGSKVEQEEYRKHIRSSLKNQMHEKDEGHKKFMVDRVSESEAAVAYDRKCLQTDRDAFIKKSVFLHKFRDENKRIMEQREAERKRNRLHQYKVDQELLRYNPINWSQSLR